MKVIRVQKVSSFSEKLLGLMFKKEYSGYLLLDKCCSVHTFWMFFAIGLISVSDKGEVLAVKKSLKPWRIYFAPRGTRSIIECTAGDSLFDEIQIGESIVLESC